MNKQAHLFSVYHPVNSDSSEVALYKTSNEEKKKKNQTEHIILMSLTETSLRLIFYET